MFMQKHKSQPWRQVCGGLLALLLLLPYAARAANDTPEAVFLPEKLQTMEFGYDWEMQRAENPIDPGFAAAILSFSARSATPLLKQAEGNLCYSPLSLYCALLLTASGARGETQGELYDVLELRDVLEQGGDPSWMAGALQRNIALDDEAHALKIAHSVWLQQGFAYQPGFLDTAAAQRGELYSADFGSAQTGNAMGRWVADHTRGLLAPDIKTKPQQALAILNTVYLKAPWSEPFPRAERAPFYREDGTVVECDFMYATLDTASGGIRDGYAWASLQLEGNMEMTLVLPDEGSELVSLLSTPEKTLEWMIADAGRRRLQIELPRFAFDTAIDLKDLLIALGVNAAFTPGGADFTGLTTTQPIVLTEARQDTRIAVDQGGIEAAAYTIIEGWAMAIPGEEPEKPLRIVFNRPFFYCVKAEGVPLLVGVVMDPSEM